MNPLFSPDEHTPKPPSRPPPQPTQNPLADPSTPHRAFFQPVFGGKNKISL